MTLSAWVRPTAAQSGWRTVIQRQADAYFLHASGDGPLQPAGGATFGSSTNYVSGPTANPLNTWTHLALTYDGAALRLYVNGAQAATRATTGAIQTTTNPLWIGGNQPYGEYFQGLIDEARVYNRALTPAEIQNDMNIPVVPAAPDTTPPSAPSGLSATAAGASQVNLSWTASTDNVGVAGYRVERCQGATCTNFTQVGTPTATTFNDTGLAASTTYRYRVRAADQADNFSAYSAIATATTATPPDTTPPSAPTGLAGTAVSMSQIDLTWTASTDTVGVTGYRVERCSGTDLHELRADRNADGDELQQHRTRGRHQLPLPGASRGRRQQPERLLRHPHHGNPVRHLGADRAVGLDGNAGRQQPDQLGWTASTDDVGVTGYRVERCQGTACTDFAQVGTPTATTFNDTGLAASTTYRYRVRAADQADNFSAYSGIATATTAAAPDTTPPTAPTGLAGTAVSMSQIDLSWSASTDAVGVTEYRVERCQGTTCTSFAQIGTPTTTSFASTGLAAGTSYRFRVRAADAAGNLSAYSDILTTATLSDTSAPSAPSGLTASPAGSSQINLSWTASTDDVGVTGYRVERCQGTGCTDFTQVAAPTATTFNDTGLSASTTYRYRVRAADQAGNLSAYSSAAEATTEFSSPDSPGAGRRLGVRRGNRRRPSPTRPATEMSARSWGRRGRQRAATVTR